MKIVGSVLAAASLSMVTSVHSSDFRVETLTEQLDHPWSMAFLPSGEMLLTERTGQLVLVAADGQLLQRSSPAIPELYVAAQGGLLDIHLAPDFTSSGRLFLSYSCGTRAANSVCLASAQYQQQQLTQLSPIFRARPDRRGAAHYGGRMAFLADESLILTLGDGFDYREQAQNNANHLGKIVRLQQDGRVPADNPFVGQPGVAAEIYSLGHRNVQGIVFDAASGLLWSHEHGPKGGDELNLLSAGANYGWPVATSGIDYTGARISPFIRFDGMQAPVYEWSPSIAPAGMTLYRGSAFPQFDGDLFITALAGRALHRLQIKEQQVVAEQKLLTELNLRLRDVRTGPDGLIYILTDGPNGKLLRLVPH